MNGDILTSGPEHRARRWPAATLAVTMIATLGWVASDGPAAPSTVPAAKPVDATDRFLLGVSFADARRGYALGARCPGGMTGLCTYQVRVTSDGGRSWLERPSPLTPTPAADGVSAELEAVGPTSVVVTGHSRWFSTDAGRTWRNTPLTWGSPVAEVPSGATIAGSCPYEGPCREPLVTIDPATGQHRPLANQPPIGAVHPHERAVRARDGSLWVSGAQGATRVVAVSRDQGRTWRTAPLSTPTTPYFGTSVVTHDGRTAYAFGRGQVSDPNVKNGLVEIWRTDDGGVRWRRLPPRAHPNSALGSALLPDGRLLVTTEEFGRSNHWLSVDGGQRFRRAEGPGLGWIDDVGGRYVAGSHEGTWYTSRDGIRWTPLISP